MPSAQGARSNFHDRARTHARQQHPGPTCPRGWTRTLRRLLRGRGPEEHPRPPAPGAPGPAPGSGARRPGGGAALTSAFVLPPTQPGSGATAAVGGPAQPPGRRPTHSSPAPAGRGALGKARNGGARPTPGTRPLTPAAPLQSTSPGLPADRAGGTRGGLRGPGTRLGKGRRGGGVELREGRGGRSEPPRPPAGVRAMVAPQPPRLPDRVFGSQRLRQTGGRFSRQPQPCAGAHLEEIPNSHQKLPAPT